MKKAILNRKESHTRSILKGLSWRVVATMTTMTIAFFITGKIHLAMEIGGIEVFAKILLYYFHERLWQTNILGILKKYLKRASLPAQENMVKKTL
jgi:uncharacterized membrane protein